MELKIKKPNDSREYFTTLIECSTHNFPNRQTVEFNRQAKDPVQSGLESFWKAVLSPRGRYFHYSFDEKFNHIVMVNGCPIVLSREGIRYGYG